jgi:hypothetical protein
MSGGDEALVIDQSEIIAESAFGMWWCVSVFIEHCPRERKTMTERHHDRFDVG